LYFSLKFSKSKQIGIFIYIQISSLRYFFQEKLKLSEVSVLNVQRSKTTWIKINRCDGGTYVEPKFFRESRAPFQEPLFYQEKYYDLNLHPKNCRCGMCVPF